MLFLSYVLHYGVSLWYLNYAWDWDTLDYNLLDEIELKGDEEMSATYYFIFFIILVPFITATVSTRSKYVDDRDSHIAIKDSGVFIGLSLLCVIQAIGIVVCTGLMLDTGTASGLGGLIFFFLYIFIAF